MTSSIDLDSCYEHVMQLVNQAGEVMKFGGDKYILIKLCWFQLVATRNSQRKTVQIKSHPTDFVTETDTQVETLLMTGITSKFPDHKFIGEEESSAGKKVELSDAPTWIIGEFDEFFTFNPALNYTFQIVVP